MLAFTCTPSTGAGMQAMPVRQALPRTLSRCSSLHHPSLLPPVPPPAASNSSHLLRGKAAAAKRRSFCNHDPWVLGAAKDFSNSNSSTTTPTPMEPARQPDQTTASTSTSTSTSTSAAPTPSASNPGAAGGAPNPQNPSLFKGFRESDHQRRLSREDYDVLPHRIILLRHAESMGNVEKSTYCVLPDHTVPLTEKGREQALAAGRYIQSVARQAHGGDDFRLFFMTSPYSRTLETTDKLLEMFTEEQVAAVRSAVQLREQDFGNFQDPQRISLDLTERMRFGRFWFRFPNGESGADVYDRLTVFEDHLTRDMMMGRFNGCSLVLVTHGLTLRIFLMRWFHWSVDEFLDVFNPNNCDPVVLEKHSWEVIQELQGNKFIHAKQCYAVTAESQAKLKGCTADMSSYVPRSTNSQSAKMRWMMHRAAQQLMQQMCKEQLAAQQAQQVQVPVKPLPPGLGFAGPLPGVRGAGSGALQSVEDPYGSLSEDEAIDWWRGNARFVVDD